MAWGRNQDKDGGIDEGGDGAGYRPHASLTGQVSVETDWMEASEVTAGLKPGRCVVAYTNGTHKKGGCVAVVQRER